MPRNEHVGLCYVSLDLNPRMPDRWSRGSESVVSIIVQVLE